MPLIQVHMAEGRTPEQKRALLAAVTEAVRTSIGAPLESIRVWVSEFPASEYMAAGELMSERRGAPPAGAAGTPGGGTVDEAGLMGL